MRTLVSGNVGYIGQILTHKLIEDGNNVVGYDCEYFPREMVFGRRDAFESQQKVSKQIKKDIRDVTQSDFEGIDTVMHLAALPNDWACDVNPQRITDDINNLGTTQFAMTAKRAGVKRFIYASSCSVFGVKGNGLINEEDTPAPISAYGVSKWNAERAIRTMNSEDFTVTCMRNATCYGVSPRMRFDMVLNNLVGWATTTGEVNMHQSNGEAWRPLIHIEDLADAYILAAKAPKEYVENQVFGVGSENYWVKDIAEIVKENVPGSHVKYYENAPQDWRSYNVNFSRIRHVLGFQPKWNIVDGARELQSAYKEIGLTKEKFVDTPRYWAGKHFKELIDSKKVDKNLRMIYD